jgi:hypothetical protein
MQQVRSYIDSLEGDVTIVSGGARGVDSVAEQQAKKRGLPVEIYRAEWERFGKSAGFRRNRDIVTNADMVVAFWDGRSRGTENTINLAKREGIPIHIFQGNDEIIIDRKPKQLKLIG